VWPNAKVSRHPQPPCPVPGLTYHPGDGYRYAGLSGCGSCYCGQTVDVPLISSSSCSTPCSGDKSENCGGSSGISIYQDTSFAPTSDKATHGYLPIGCWTDSSSYGKALSHKQNIEAKTMTPDVCLKSCLADGYTFAGLEKGSKDSPTALISRFRVGCKMIHHSTY
jgi:hypothetical protein